MTTENTDTPQKADCPSASCSAIWDRAVDTLASMCVADKMGSGPTKKAFILTLQTYAREMGKLIQPSEALPRLQISDVRWEYEDQLPEMEDADFDTIFPASRVIGMECGGVRMYPYVEDLAGNRIWISHLPDETLTIDRP